MNHFHWKLKWCDPFGSCNKKLVEKVNAPFFFCDSVPFANSLNAFSESIFVSFVELLAVFRLACSFAWQKNKSDYLLMRAIIKVAHSKKTNEHYRAVCIHLFGLLGGSSFILVDQYFLRVSTMFCLSILLFEIIISSYWLHNSYKHRLIWEHLCSTIV